jgi:GAF domain-containing protein
VNLDLGTVMATAARELNTKPGVDETLDMIVKTAQHSLPGFGEIGISTIDRDGNVTTRARTSELVDELDQLQYQLGEGPCVDTLRSENVVVVPNLRHDQRWPRYVRPAVELGLKSQLAVRLFLDSQGTLGGLNLYSTESEDIHPEAENIAELFAAHAAIALGHAREVDGLNQALATRKVIGQAIGMLMAQYNLTDDAAFGLLVRTSSHNNVKLRDIAAMMVDEANSRAVV